MTLRVNGVDTGRSTGSFDRRDLVPQIRQIGKDIHFSSILSDNADIVYRSADRVDITVRPGGWADVCVVDTCHAPSVVSIPPSQAPLDRIARVSAIVMEPIGFVSGKDCVFEQSFNSLEEIDQLVQTLKGYEYEMFAAVGERAQLQAMVPEDFFDRAVEKFTAEKAKLVHGVGATILVKAGEKQTLL